MKIVFHLPLRLEIYQTQETMFHQVIQTPKRVLKIRRKTGYF